MKATDFKLTRYDADKGMVFDWVEPHYIENENGEKTQEHLFAKTLFIGETDTIENYVEIVDEGV